MSGRVRSALLLSISGAARSRESTKAISAVEQQVEPSTLTTAAAVNAAGKHNRSNARSSASPKPPLRDTGRSVARWRTTVHVGQRRAAFVVVVVKSRQRWRAPLHLIGHCLVYILLTLAHSKRTVCSARHTGRASAN